jgi:hypothetical protein
MRKSTSSPAHACTSADYLSAQQVLPPSVPKLAYSIRLLREPSTPNRADVSRTIALRDDTPDCDSVLSHTSTCLKISNIFRAHRTVEVLQTYATTSSIRRWRLQAEITGHDRSAFTPIRLVTASFTVSWTTGRVGRRSLAIGRAQECTTRGCWQSPC